MADTRIPSKTIILITGSSNTGKSYLISELLANSTYCFKDQIGEVILCHGPLLRENDSSIRRIVDSVPPSTPVQIRTGFPETDLMNGTLWKIESMEKPRVLILDDLWLWLTKKNQFSLSYLATCLVNHHNLIVSPPGQTTPASKKVNHLQVIITNQNLYATDGSGKDTYLMLLRNCHLIYIMVDIRASVVAQNLARKLFPSDPEILLLPFRETLKEQKPFSFLTVNFRARQSDELVVQGGIPRRDCFKYHKRQ